MLGRGLNRTKLLVRYTGEQLGLRYHIVGLSQGIVSEPRSTIICKEVKARRQSVECVHTYTWPVIYAEDYVQLKRKRGKLWQEVEAKWVFLYIAIRRSM